VGGDDSAQASNMNKVCVWCPICQLDHKSVGKMGNVEVVCCPFVPDGEMYLLQGALLQMGDLDSQRTCLN